jgi:HK97 family phage major capsid protein
MDLRSQIRAELEAAQRLTQLAVDEKRGNTEQELATIRAHEDKAAELQRQLDAQTQAVTRNAQLNERLAQTAGAPPTQPRQAVDPSNQAAPHITVEHPGGAYQRGDAFGALIAARFRFGTDHAAARAHYAGIYGESSPQARAMQAQSFAGGGSLIAPNFVGQELIELLRATAQVRRAGARSLRLVGGTATIPKITGGAVAYWGNEGDNITPSELATGDITLVEKKLTALVPVSNRLLRNADIGTERLIRDDMVRAAANEEDLQFLRGDGLAGKPKGIYYWVGAAGRTNSAGTSLANTRTDIRVQLNRLGNNNVPLVSRAFFMPSRAVNYYGWDLVDGNGNFAFASMQQENPTLAGAKVYPSNNLPITLGGGSNASEQYYVEMSECFIGDNPDVEIEVFMNATYADASGTLRSGISRDESAVRLLRFTDFAMRHTQSAHVIEADTRGA